MRSTLRRAVDALAPPLSREEEVYAGTLQRLVRELLGMSRSLPLLIETLIGIIFYIMG